jgi:hypothetical protein
MPETWIDAKGKKRCHSCGADWRSNHNCKATSEPGDQYPTVKTKPKKLKESTTMHSRIPKLIEAVREHRWHDANVIVSHILEDKAMERLEEERKQAFTEEDAYDFKSKEDDDAKKKKDAGGRDWSEYDAKALKQRRAEKDADEGMNEAKGDFPLKGGLKPQKGDWATQKKTVGLRKDAKLHEGKDLGAFQQPDGPGDGSHWKVEFIVGNDDKWYGNAMVYATREEALSAGGRKADHWTAVNHWRVTPCPAKVNEETLNEVMIAVKCNECGKKYKMGHASEPRCPKCNGSDVEPQ